jgi:hypothetical protein
MAKKVVVSSAQKSAASAMVKRSAVTGRYVSNSVRKIANAKVQPINGKKMPDSSSYKVSKLVIKPQRP